MSLEPTTSTSAWRCLGYRLTENGDSVENNRIKHPSNVAQYAPSPLGDANNLVWGIRWRTEKLSDGKYRWVGHWVRPSADWKYPEEIEDTDPVLLYWASIGVESSPPPPSIRSSFVPPRRWVKAPRGLRGFSCAPKSGAASPSRGERRGASRSWSPRIAPEAPSTASG